MKYFGFVKSSFNGKTTINPFNIDIGKLCICQFRKCTNGRPRKNDLVEFTFNDNNKINTFKILVRENKVFK